MAWTPKGNIRGPQGDTGLQGAKGDPGAQGTAGEKWFSGSGAPGGTQAPGSSVGDWYLNVANGDVYEQTSSGVWTLRGNIRGPQGNTGAQGPQGPQGATGSQGPQGATGLAEVWWSGAGVPPTGTGAIGDWYLNTSTGDVYEKTAASTWTLRCNIKGAQGIQGPTGATGSQGPQGNTGPQGPQGAKGDTGATGAAGLGVPAGGALGAILRKKSATDNDTEWKPLASAQVVSSLNPPEVVGTTGRMLGLGTATYGPFLITPTASGKVLVILSFGLISDTANAQIIVGIRYGTGTPPANQAIPPVSSILGSTFVRSGVWAVNQAQSVTLTWLATGLTVGTQYWFDLGMQAGAAGQGVSVAGNYFSAVELP